MADVGKESASCAAAIFAQGKHPMHARRNAGSIAASAISPRSSPMKFAAALATALLAEAKCHAPGSVRLTVNQDNPRAAAFYRREGFRMVGQGANPNSGLQTWDLVWP